MATKTHVAAWKVWGNRKDNRVFTACLPKTARCKAGDRVSMVNKVGIETTGTLVALHAADDGLEYWTFDKDRKPRDQYLLDVAKQQAARAQYLADNAESIAAKIDAREARKAAQEQQAATPNQNGSPKSPKAATETATDDGVVDAFSAQVAAFVAAGLEPGAAALAAIAIGLTPNTSVATPGTVTTAEVATSTPRKPRQSRVTKQAAPIADVVATEAAKQGGCRACGKRTATLHRHVGAKVDGVCSSCMLKDAETVRMNVIRRSAKAAQGK